MATTISIPGGGSQPLVFTVTGTSTTNYALAFASAVNGAGNLSVNVLSDGAPQTSGGMVLNEIFDGGPYTLTYGDEYTTAFVGLPTDITGSTAGGDTVMASGAATYTAVGGNDNVDFISGYNLFTGDTASGDTITGGSGQDTINTGSGASTVFSGAGSTLIELNDTAGGTSGDVVYLGDGHSTVLANGLNDTVAAGTNGQTIFGGAGNLTVNILDNSTSSGAAGDAIIGGSGNTSVFDSVGGNSIFGGSGSLVFQGETGTAGMTADSIVAGSGTTSIFLSGGNEVDLTSSATSGSVGILAGLGNETLNGAGADSFSFFADLDTTSSASLTVYAGSGTDYFATGSGTEDYTTGGGVDVFGLNTVASAADITINDFGASDYVSFVGQSDSQITSALDSATSGSNSVTITLSDSTTVTFVGITSLTGHII